MFSMSGISDELESMVGVTHYARYATNKLKPDKNNTKHYTNFHSPKTDVMYLDLKLLIKM